MVTTRPATRLARPLDLGDARWATDADVAARFEPGYAASLGRVPAGDLVARGLPFRLAPPGAAPRWLLVDRTVTVPLGGTEAAWLVLLAFCDAWRDATGARPTGVPVGWVLPVGEPLARLRITRTDGTTVDQVLRRRFEVNEGIIGWGNGGFRCVPYLEERPVDWRGPHPRLAPGRPAGPGHAGPLAILPGGWGAAQTGVEDHVPSATDDVMLWLHAIEVSADGAPAALRAVTLEPLPGVGAGRDVVVAGLTAFAGPGQPLRWAPRRSLRVTGGRDREVAVDLGLVARRRDLPTVPPSLGLVEGWGTTPSGLPGSADATAAEELEVVVAEDATLRLGGEDQVVRLRDLDARGGVTVGPVRIEALPDADRRMRVVIVDEAGLPAAARVRCVAPDGRYLAPVGHRDEVNPGINEDIGADLLLGSDAWAYVDGGFEVDLPAVGASLDVMAGPARAPVRCELRPADPTADPTAEVGQDPATVRLVLAPALAPTGGRWVSGDTHVHFLAPSTALLQARAEGVNAVHLLAAHWGDLHTGVTDVGTDQRHPDGMHRVWVGSENRHTMLGHVGLVGTGHPVLPFSDGGAPEGRIGGATTLAMADWLRRARDGGGLAIGAHFPLPMTEVPADIAAGLLDALEMQCFDPDLSAPPIREWYRYLSAGFRLPLVGGTDKMSAEVPLGQIRTWARLEDGAELDFESWAAAIRAGRTFVSSGPLLSLEVDGCGPGDQLAVAGGGHVEVSLVATAAQPIIGALEVVLDGRVVAAAEAPRPVTRLELHERVLVERSGWLAGRSRSPHAIGSAFASSMAAHTSAVHLDVPGRPPEPGEMDLPLTLIEGMRAWLGELAAIRDPRDRERILAFLASAEATLRERGARRP